VRWLRRFFGREEYVVHRLEIPVSTIVRWYMYDTDFADQNELAELIGLSKVSKEGDVKEQEDSDNRLEAIEQYIPFLTQMAEISANLITTIHTKELQDSGLLVDSIDDRQIEMMQDLFKTIALSTLVGTFSVGTRLQIINPTSAPTGFIQMEDNHE